MSFELFAETMARMSSGNAYHTEGLTFEKARSLNLVRF